jgi:nucleoside-diphosphate-sugar epimerase
VAHLNVVATGTTGTIGKCLPRHVMPLDVDLRSSIVTFEQLEFPPDGALIHLAGLVGASICEENSRSSLEINVNGTRKLASVFRKKSKSTFVFISTGHVYRSSLNLISEEDEIEPISVYARHKFLAEQECQQIFAGEPERLIILRVFSVLDWNTAKNSLGYTVTQAVNSGEKINIVNSDDVRDFLTPTKVAQVALRMACMKEVSGTYNVCSGRGTTVADAIKRMLEEAGLSHHPLEVHPGNSIFPVLVGSNSKLRKVLSNLHLDWMPSHHKR